MITHDATSAARLKAVFCIATIVSLFAPAVVAAQTDSREEAMFGEESEEDAREADMFGGETYEDATVSDRHRALLDQDRLQLGGMLYLRFMMYGYEGDDFDPPLASPNLLDLYLDARPNDRVRGFVRGRLAYDPLTTSAYPGMPADLDLPEGMELPAADPLTVSLDQLWLKFDIARTLYVTIGKQPVHWGTTRIWNPVDVINSTRRVPLSLFDDRGGVFALKVHWPIEKLAWNLIGIVLLDQADYFDKMGGALRLETVFSTVELSLTGMVKEELDLDGEEYVVPKVALDLSAGIWDLDLTGEIAMVFRDVSKAPGNEDEEKWTFTAGEREVPIQASVGVSYTGKYTAEDFFMVGGEYFYNSAGTKSTDDYFQMMFIDQNYTPFYVGRHYLAAYFVLPGPGSWDYTNFSLSAVANLSDESYLFRFDFSTVVLTYLNIQAYISLNSGKKGGEFHSGFPEDSLFPGSPAVPYQFMTLGVNLRIDI